LNNITNESLKLFKQKKINKIINMPLNKKKFLGKKFIGFTEFFSKKLNNLNNSNMLLFNNNFSVCPLTTHIQIKDVNKEITKSNFIKAINNINTFYNKILKKKPQIIVLGLNPHCSKDFDSKTVDQKLLSKEILLLKKKKINIIGPVSADTAFLKYKNKVFVGMYHDQVLIPFKLINKFDGINLTIGNKIIRMSPDHGTAETLIKKRKYISNQSFIKCLKFCEKY
ncbi:MAG: 4-hydroxythreonine-4-phosphate dehydrogenase PdxA, partial [Pelagibacteraceae bacterium]